MSENIKLPDVPSPVAQQVAQDIEYARRARVNVLISGGDEATRGAIARLLSGRGPRGVLVLVDELADLCADVQAGLTRMLERQPRMRVVATTAHNLLERVKAKVFDETLFYRLNMVHIVLR